jgi:hypothetical protein
MMRKIRQRTLVGRSVADAAVSRSVSALGLFMKGALVVVDASGPTLITRPTAE